MEPANKLSKKEHITVAPNSIEVGSRWIAPNEEEDVRDYIQGAVAFITHLKNKFHVIRSNKHVVTIACTNVPRSASTETREAICTFVVHCKWEKGHAALVIKECCLSHSCLGMICASQEGIIKEHQQITRMTSDFRQ